MASEDARRDVLKIAAGSVGAAIGAAVALPGLALVAHPLRRATIGGLREPIRVARLDEVEPGRPLRRELRGELRDGWTRLPEVQIGSCFLVRASADAPVRALSTVCPHLGCSVDWDAGRRRFACPCHASIFAPDGSVVGGPAPRDMDELEVVVDGTDVRVIHRRFRVGLPEKVEV